MTEPPRHKKGSRVVVWWRARGWQRRRLAYVAPTRLGARRVARRLIPAAQTPPSDPIIRAEIMHLSRRDDQRRRPVAVLFYIAFGLSIALTVAVDMIARSSSLTTVNMRGSYTSAANALGVVNITLLVLGFVAQLMLTGQALLLASDTIAREKEGGTWDLVILTGRSARQIVLGKWWAVQQYLFQRYRLLIFLRATALFWFGLTALRGSFFNERPDALSLLVAPALVLGGTVLSMALASAAGVTASAAFRRGLAYPATLALFIVCLIPFGVAYLVQTYVAFRLQRLPMTGPLAMIAVPADGGEMVALGLMRHLSTQEWIGLASATVASVVVFVALTWGLLLLAQRVARSRSGIGA